MVRAVPYRVEKIFVLVPKDEIRDMVVVPVIIQVANVAFASDEDLNYKPTDGNASTLRILRQDHGVMPTASAASQDVLECLSRDDVLDISVVGDPIPSLKAGNGSPLQIRRS